MIKSLIRIGDKIIKLRYVILPKHIAQFGKKLTKRKKDLIFIISGYPGEGKSVLAIAIAKEYDRRFTYDRNLIYSRSELMEKIETLPPSAFIIDEAINILYKREWNKGSQKDMIKLLNICRSKGHMLIFVQPDFEDMDKDIRTKRLRLWIDVITRGCGVLYKPVKSLGGGSDPWNIEINDKRIKEQIKKLGVVEGYLEGSAKTENFQNVIRWEDIPEEEYKIYDEVKNRKKYAEEDNILYTEKEAKMLARKDIFKVISVLKANNLVKRGFISYVANTLGLSIASTSSYLKDATISQNLNNVKDLDNEEDAIRL